MMKKNHNILTLFCFSISLLLTGCRYDVEWNHKLQTFANSGVGYCLQSFYAFTKIPFSNDSTVYANWEEYKKDRPVQAQDCQDLLNTRKLLLARYFLPNKEGKDSVVYPFGATTVTDQDFYYSLGAGYGRCHINGVYQSETYHLGVTIGGENYPSVLMYSALHQDTLSKKWVLTEFYIAVPDSIPIIRNRNLPKRFDLYDAFQKADYKVPFLREPYEQFSQ